MIEDKVKPLMMRFAPSLANQDFKEVFSPVIEKKAKVELAKNAAMCEVMQGVFLIVELLLPTRNLMFTFIWWQYLQMRYMGDRDGLIKIAFSSLDLKISNLISHRLCPKVLGRGYDFLKKFLAEKVKPPQRSNSQNASSGVPSISSMFKKMKSKCSVM